MKMKTEILNWAKLINEGVECESGWEDDICVPKKGVEDFFQAMSDMMSKSEEKLKSEKNQMLRMYHQGRIDALAFAGDMLRIWTKGAGISEGCSAVDEKKGGGGDVKTGRFIEYRDGKIIPDDYERNEIIVCFGGNEDPEVFMLHGGGAKLKGGESIDYKEEKDVA